MQKKKKLWNKNFILAICLSVMTSMTNQVFSPVLSVYAKGLGIGTDLVGTIVAVATIITMFGRALIGWLSDRREKKRLVAGSIGFLMAGFVLYLFATNAPILWVARILHGVGSGLLVTVLSTLAIESLPEERMGAGLGIYSLGESLAQCVAPLLGTALASAGKFRLLFILALATVALAFVILLFVDKSEPAPRVLLHRDSKKKRFEFHISAFIYKGALVGAVMLLFLGIVHNAVSNYLAIYGLEQGLPQISMFFTAFSLLLLVFRPLIGGVADRVPPALLMIPGFLLIGVAFLLLVDLHSMTQVYLSALLYGVGYGATMTMSQVISVRGAPAEKRGVANSTFYVLGDIGLSLGAYVAGFLAKWLGYGYSFLAMAIVSVLAVVVYLLCLLGTRKTAVSGAK